MGGLRNDIFSFLDSSETGEVWVGMHMLFGVVGALRVWVGGEHIFQGGWALGEGE